jgi:YVTN family beta-propeller protein
VVAAIGVGQKPRDLVFSAARRELYVANSASDDLSVIDAATGRVQKTVRLRAGDEPSRLALSADETRLYVLNAGSSSLAVVDLSASQELARVQLPSAPAALAVDELNNVVYVASRDSDRLFAVDPSTSSFIALPGFGGNVDEIAVASRERKIYAAKNAQRQIAIFDIAKGAVEGNLRLCGACAGLLHLPSSRILFASTPDCGALTAFKPEQNLEAGSLFLPYAPGRIGVDREGKRLLVAFPVAGKVGFYNANSWSPQGMLDVGKSPFAVAFAQ